MPTVFTLLRNRDMADALGRYFRYGRGWTAVHLDPPVTPQAVDNGLQVRDVWPPQAFRHVADRLEEHARHAGGESRLLGSVVVVETDDDQAPRQPSATEVGDRLQPLNPMAVDRDPWTSAVSMLVLAFPEIHWVLYSVNRHAGGFQPPHRRVHVLATCSSATVTSVASLIGAGLYPLFDATALRDTLRREILNTTDNDGRRICTWLPLRKQLAVSIDEEAPYAFLTAYAAYKFGYRAAPLLTHTAMKAVLGDDGRSLVDSPSVSFEDLYINTPDKPHDLHLAKLSQRDKHLPRLCEAATRIVVTGNHQRVEQDVADSNREHVADLTKRHVHVEFVLKPLAGIYELWRQSKLRNRPGGGMGPGFGWPPAGEAPDTPVGGHSAPGRLLCIADRLALRASAILHSARSVPEVVHGAVLALESVEYLGHRTPTASLEALSLQHRLEVMAECMFHGVQQNLDVRERMNDIARDVRSISEWVDGERQPAFIANARLALVNNLVKAYRESNRFDEEQKCLSGARDLNREIWWQRRDEWTLLPLRGWLARGVRWYLDSRLRSIPSFVRALAFWVVLFIVAFGALCTTDIADTGGPATAVVAAATDDTVMSVVRGVWERLLHGIRDTATAFFGIQPPHEKDASSWLLGITVAAMALGVVHLGIFISHVYSLIARR
ncbi:MAG: hypothetical protein ACRD3G_30695 [Vicinamibacterales bacterium]